MNMYVSDILKLHINTCVSQIFYDYIFTPALSLIPSGEEFSTHCIQILNFPKK
uniref:Uncharacterized protein n=1 Tax=Anguilla anguilla TaxID=7936 RepID=A0A0E9SK64_ANGAN